jgi:large subunit ribosomal protein L25
MNINDTVNVADLKLPEGVAAVFDQNYAVVSVLAKAKDDAPAEEEAAAEA